MSCVDVYVTVSSWPAKVVTFVTGQRLVMVEYATSVAVCVTSSPGALSKIVVGTSVTTLLVTVLVTTYVSVGPETVSMMGHTVWKVTSTVVVVAAVTVGPGTVVAWPSSQLGHSVTTAVDVMSSVT
jgi:hypothetical protein